MEQLNIIINKLESFNLGFLLVLFIFLIIPICVLLIFNIIEYLIVFIFFLKFNFRKKISLIDRFIFALRQTSKQKISSLDLSNYENACKSGDLKFIKNLFKNKRLAYWHSKKLWYDIFTACEYGHLNILKYLYTSPRFPGLIKDNNLLLDSPKESIKFGHVECVAYLDNMAIKKNFKFNILKNSLNELLFNEYFDVIKYMIESSQEHKKIVHALFYCLVHHFSYSFNRTCLRLVKYFAQHMSIEKDSVIYQIGIMFLQSNNVENREKGVFLLNLIAKEKILILKSDLESELLIQPTSSKRIIKV